MFSRNRTHAFAFVQRSFRKISSTAPGNNPENLSPIKKVIKFVSKNRQGFLNIIAMYFVLTIAIHNFKVKEAWEERDLEVAKLNSDYLTLKEALQNKEWLEEVEKKIRAAKPAQNILAQELAVRLETFEPKKEDPKKLRKGKDEDAEKLPMIGKDAVGISVNSKDSGKFI